jgi:hypothetical protein
MKALHFLLLLFLLQPLLTLSAANISFYVHQESSSVYYGDTINARLVLKTAGEKLPTPSTPTASNPDNSCSIQISEAPSVSQSSNVQIINGKRTVSSNVSYIWDASISPNSTNDVKNISFEVIVGGETYTARLEPVTIIPPSVVSPFSPFVQVELSSDKTNVICEDSFRITATIRLKAITVDGKAKSPISNRAIPHLTLPHLDEKLEGIRLLAGEPNELNNYLTSSGFGFSINNYVSSNGFGFFSSPTLSVFNIPNTISPIDGTNFITYSWTTIYKAKNSGTILFKPISLRGKIIFEPAKDSYCLTPHLFLVSEPLKITINEPPLEGRPASFIGAISDKLKAETSLDTQNCKEGDPITLTLKLENVENPLSVTPPKLDELDGFKNNFRAFGEIKATPNEADKNATFEYSIRPITSGTIEVPAIELGYYNLTTNQYATITTIPVPIRVDPAPQVAAIDGSEAVDLPDEVVRYYPTAISFDTSTTSGSISFLIKQLAIISPFIWVVVLLLRKILSKRKRLIEYIKNMSATEAAIKRLSNANVPAEVMSAVSTFISKKFKIKTTGSTPDDILKALNEKKISSEIITQLSKPLKRIFDLSFAPNADIPTEVTDAKEKLLPVLQKLKGKSSTLPQICICIGAIVACIAIVVGPIIAAILLSISTTQIEKRSTPDEYELRQANLLVNAAVSKKDFTAIATNYYTRFSYNFNSSKPIPALLHNYATALTLADHPQKAIDVIDYIETITGTTKELDNSRLFAMQSLQEQDSLQTEEDGISTILESPTLPWYRMPLFWHYQYSISERGNALCIIWTILWVLLIIRLFPTNRKPVNIAIAIAFVAFIFVSSSYLASRELLKKPIPEITAEELLLEQEQTIEEGLPNE